MEKRGHQKKRSVGDGMSEEGKCRRWDVRRKEAEERGRQKKGSVGEELGHQKGSGGDGM